MKSHKFTIQKKRRQNKNKLNKFMITHPPNKKKFYKQKSKNQKKLRSPQLKKM
jgi:hypothetical protein